MMSVNVLSGTCASRPAVYVEPDEEPGSGRARVRVVFSLRDDARSNVQDFESLSDALAYAQSLLDDGDAAAIQPSGCGCR